GDGAGQADFFHATAGDMAGFAIAVDVEPATESEPTADDAHACVARLRELYPSHPVIGYIPQWYWGTRSTRFVDVLWASNYVTGTGRPATLYAKVTPSQWARYGGRAPALLQFTNAATVPGVSGRVDCSAFRGTAARLRDRLLPNASRQATEDLMQPGFLLAGEGAITPLAIPNGAKRLRFFSNRPAQVRGDLIGVGEPSATLTLGYDHGAQGVATGGALAAVVHRVDAGDNEVSYVVTGLSAPRRPRRGRWAAHLSVGLLAADARQPGGHDVVQLDDGEGDNAGHGVDEADQGRERVQALREQDPAPEGGQPGEGLPVVPGHQRRAPVPGGRLQPHAEQQEVQPVHAHRQPEMDVVGEQRGGKRQQRHHEQETEVDPGQGPVAAAEDAEQRVLGQPERAQHRKAQQVRGEVRALPQQRRREPVLGLGRSGGAHGHPQIQHQQRHGDGEQPVAQRRQVL